jgi:hypothetical protein
MDDPGGASSRLRRCNGIRTGKRLAGKLHELVAHIFARNFQLAQTSPRWMSEFMIDLTQAVAQFHETTEIKIRIKVNPPCHNRMC